MAWKSLREVGTYLEKSESSGVIEPLYNLQMFLEHCVLPPNYEVDLRWSELVVPSPEAEYLIHSDPALKATFNEAELLLACFVTFSHHSLLIDPERCATTPIKELISSEIVETKLLLPYRFGRMLYDRFNDLPETGAIEHMPAEQAMELLHGTPQGIYQVGNLVSGPFGLVESSEQRLLPPVPALPLWHCSDTGCGALHQVILVPPPVSIVRAVSELRRAAEDLLGLPSEWQTALSRLHRRGRWRGGRPYYDLAAVLAEGFSEEERQTLFTRIMSSPAGQSIRATLIGARGKQAAAGSPTDLASRLSDTERLQMLLTLSDEALVKACDRGIWEGAIKIASHEVRETKLNPPRVSARDRVTQISSLGFRARHKAPIINFVSLLWRAYASHGLLEELGWRVRRRTGVPSRSAVADYLRLKEPREAVRELVLSSMPVTMFLSQELWLEAEEYGDVALLADRLLWKMGFDPARHDDTLSLLRKRIEQFNETLFRIGVVRTESDREIVRSAGVNLFVSVEQFLQELISYNVWVLGSDHFVNTGFEYSHSQAVSLVHTVLGESITSGEAVFEWDPSGTNALGTLLVYAQEASRWISSLSSLDASGLARAIDDLPHYAEDEERPFPFRHQVLWADFPPQLLKAYADGFAAIVNLIAQADVARIRNGLDHKRSDELFPTTDAMLLCAARLREAVEQADVKRYVPKLFWLRQMQTDRFGRLENRFEEYAGRELILHGPTLVIDLPTLGFEEPILVPAGELLAEYASTLRFRMGSTGSFAEYWANYPRRRKIPSPHKEGVAAVDTSSA